MAGAQREEDDFHLRTFQIGPTIIALDTVVESTLMIVAGHLERAVSILDECSSVEKRVP